MCPSRPGDLPGADAGGAPTSDARAGDAWGEAPRMLFVHAHPDDETIITGATIATYAACGADVTVLTCTRGERGEILPDDLAHLRGKYREFGEHREGELTAACVALGVAHHSYLGQDAGQRYSDSGMTWQPDGTAGPAPDAPADAFSTTDLAELSPHLQTVVRQRRPNVVVSYDAGGGYGHPDHVHVHHLVKHALSQLDREYRPDKTYEALFDFSGTLEGDHGATAAIDGTAHLAAKRAALRAHRSQISLVGDEFTLAHPEPMPVTGVELYMRSDIDNPPIETDLLAGVW